MSSDAFTCQNYYLRKEKYILLTCHSFFRIYSQEKMNPERIFGWAPDFLFKFILIHCDLKSDIFNSFKIETSAATFNNEFAELIWPQ